LGRTVGSGSPSKKAVSGTARQRGDAIEHRGADAVDARLVFMDLLVGHADRQSEIVPGDALLLPQRPQAPANMDIDGVGPPSGDG
jgi:hypothetical protein